MEKRIKIYIAGKITGDPNYQIKFKKVEEDFKKMGFAVLNPATLPPGMESSDYMRICFAMLDIADAVLFLPDWKESPGARLERDYCVYTGKKSFYL